MEKKIKIGEKEYLMHASALTQFSYKNETGRSFLQDVKKLAKISIEEIKKNSNEEELFEILDNITDLVLPLAYVMVKEADSNQVVNYDEFLKGINCLYDEILWIQEVILLACSPISTRQLQNS